jgi:hypothetical protein
MPFTEFSPTVVEVEQDRKSAHRDIDVAGYDRISACQSNHFNSRLRLTELFGALLDQLELEGDMKWQIKYDKANCWAMRTLLCARALVAIGPETASTTIRVQINRNIGLCMAPFKARLSIVT